MEARRKDITLFFAVNVLHVAFSCFFRYFFSQNAYSYLLSLNLILAYQILCALSVGLYVKYLIRWKRRHWVIPLGAVFVLIIVWGFQLPNVAFVILCLSQFVIYKYKAFEIQTYEYIEPYLRKKLRKKGWDEEEIEEYIHCKFDDEENKKKGVLYNFLPSLPAAIILLSNLFIGKYYIPRPWEDIFSAFPH